MSQIDQYMKKNTDLLQICLKMTMKFEQLL